MPKRSRLVPTIRNPDLCPDFEWLKQDGGQIGGHFVSSLDRFVIKKYFIHDSFLYKTVYASNRTGMSGFRSVRYSNARDWHKIEFEYRRQFGIWKLTVCTQNN
jgi:hypothetical protein